MACHEGSISAATCYRDKRRTMSTRPECWFAPLIIVLSNVMRRPQDCLRGPQRWCATASSASSVAVAQESASKYTPPFHKAAHRIPCPLRAQPIVHSSHPQHDPPESGKNPNMRDWYTPFDARTAPRRIAREPTRERSAWRCSARTTARIRADGGDMPGFSKWVRSAARRYASCVWRVCGQAACVQEGKRARQQSETVQSEEREGE